ncbi:enamine deaminase RidA (YjgF/YER057c/UK114 family) [Rhizobium sp. BK196]|uniref:RidA family protein n=1 Tax=unclassified Rhizobium TaxID=2613769 RepID=UPI00160D40FE|nr:MULTISPECIES: RidA family protein [unclassified Rhizobium]MBB3311622.1 enamine deaminase RidA (YjgF/YER057c/UK114 family) [Rhizobium sp. BK196]MBB3460844.1 enamine deaminase RidA (YjgF/YER057c/UK114 family) [Rhizobium sp. BK377]
MELVKHNPSRGIYAATSDYIHAIEVRHPVRFLFVSGTMGLDAECVPGRDLSVQLDLIWSNLRAILADADMDVSNIVRLTSYLRDPDYAEANQNARLAALGDHIVPTTAIVVRTLQKDWLVEIEIIAAA